MKKFTLKVNVSKKQVKKPTDLPFERTLVIEMEDGKSYSLPYGESLNNPTQEQLEHDKKEAFGLMIEEGLECMEFKDNPQGLDEFFQTRKFNVNEDNAVKEMCLMKSKLNELGFSDMDIKELAKKYPYSDVPEKLKQKRKNK